MRIIEHITRETLELARTDDATLFLLWNALSPVIAAQRQEARPFVDPDVPEAEISRRAFEGVICAIDMYLDGADGTRDGSNFEEYVAWWIRQAIITGDEPR